jgi:hypothetical protein
VVNSIIIGKKGHGIEAGAHLSLGISLSSNDNSFENRYLYYH